MNRSLERECTLTYLHVEAIFMQLLRMAGVGDGNRTLAKLKTKHLNRARVTPNAPTEHICAVTIPLTYPHFSHVEMFRRAPGDE